MRISEYQRITGPFVDNNFKERFPLVQEQIKSKGGGDITPFINGFGQVLPPSMYNQLNFFSPPPSWTEPNVYYFFFRAFKAIMQQAVKDDLDNLLFVEDDLQFLDGFDEVLESGLKSLPDDWDMLYYGSNNCWHPTEEIGTNLLKLNGSYCLHCVGFRGKKLIKEMANLPEIKGVDITLGQTFHNRYNCYALWPNKAVQRPSRSTLVNMEVNYLDYFKSKGKNWT